MPLLQLIAPHFVHPNWTCKFNSEDPALLWANVDAMVEWQKHSPEGAVAAAAATSSATPSTPPVYAHGTSPYHVPASGLAGDLAGCVPGTIYPVRTHTPGATVAAAAAAPRPPRWFTPRVLAVEATPQGISQLIRKHTRHSMLQSTQHAALLAGEGVRRNGGGTAATVEGDAVTAAGVGGAPSVGPEMPLPSPAAAHAAKTAASASPSAPLFPFSSAPGGSSSGASGTSAQQTAQPGPAVGPPKPQPQ